MNQEVAICKLLERMGYANVEHNCGSIWYDDENGTTWCISAMECESEGASSLTCEKGQDERRRRNIRDVV